MASMKFRLAYPDYAGACMYSGPEGSIYRMQ